MKIFTVQKYLLAVYALFAGTTVFGAIPTGYYDALEGKSGVTLKKAVKTAARNHTAIDYGTSTWAVFIESDTRMVGGQRCWWDMYSSNNVAAPSASKHDGLNIEHSVANSWWGGTKNDAYKDLMHLNPSDADANNRKSNYPLGEVYRQTWSNGITTVGQPKSGDCGGASMVYEPADEYKGDFARAFFYMFTIYDDISWKTSSGYGYMYSPSSDLLLKPWAYEMLLEWAKNDPVSQKEKDRNEVIYKHQKNRNPFIDYPELAEHIWGSKKNTPFHLDSSVDPDPDPDPNPDPVLPDTPVAEGYWYAVTSSVDLNTTDKYILVSTDNNVVMAYKTNGNTSVTYFQPCSGAPKFDNSVSPARISDIPADAAILTLGNSGSNWTIAVSDKDGKSYGYLSSTETKKVSLASSSTASGTTLTITPNSESTSIKFTAAGGNLQYNNQENGKRFTTYTSTQEPVRLYRLEAKNQNEDAGIGTGTLDTAEEVIYGIYDINGRKVAAKSISELEKGIYIVISNFGTRKILK